MIWEGLKDLHYLDHSFNSEAALEESNCYYSFRGRSITLGWTKNCSFWIQDLYSQFFRKFLQNVYQFKSKIQHWSKKFSYLSQHRNVRMMLFRSCKLDSTGHYKIFESSIWGKIFLFCGDFRQTQAAFPEGSRQAIVKYCGSAPFQLNQPYRFNLPYTCHIAALSIIPFSFQLLPLILAPITNQHRNTITNQIQLCSA